MFQTSAELEVRGSSATRRLANVLIDIIRLGSSPDEQAAHKKLQALALVLPPMNKFDAGNLIMPMAQHRRFDNHRCGVIRDVEFQAHDRALGKLARGGEAATAHGNVEHIAVTFKAVAAKQHRETHRHTVVIAMVFVDAHVAHAPLEEAKAKTADLAFERIDVKPAGYPFSQSDANN